MRLRISVCAALPTTPRSSLSVERASADPAGPSCVASVEQHPFADQRTGQVHIEIDVEEGPIAQSSSLEIPLPESAISTALDNPDSATSESVRVMRGRTHAAAGPGRSARRARTATPGWLPGRTRCPARCPALRGTGGGDASAAAPSIAERPRRRFGRPHEPHPDEQAVAPGGGHHHLDQGGAAGGAQHPRLGADLTDRYGADEVRRQPQRHQVGTARLGADGAFRSCGRQRVGRSAVLQRCRPRTGGAGCRAVTTRQARLAQGLLIGVVHARNDATESVRVRLCSSEASGTSLPCRSPSHAGWSAPATCRARQPYWPRRTLWPLYFLS